MTAIAACRTCGTEPLENARFCHGCGSPVDEVDTRAEYKQVTVLFADVVHSMDIAAAVGTERLREVMAGLVDRAAVVVQRYGGTVDKFTGDGIMAVFGAPVALEDHASRACRAALEIHSGISDLAQEVSRRDGVELQLRVGLNSGEVIAGEIGSGATGYTALGEQVGTAQRMESVAPPGGVMLSESTARLVENSAVLAKPEMVRIKGAEDAVPARRLLGVAPQRRMDGAESTFVGRQWEMSALAAMLGQAINGNGHVVGVVGPPGIGKSRIARETAALAMRQGVAVFTTYCESHTTDIAFRTVTGLLRAALGTSELDDVAARARVHDRLADADSEDLLLLDDLLGIADPEVALPQIDPDARRRRLTALLNTASLARSTPAVYVIEDAHWIDEASESMIAEWLSVVPQTRSLVLITYRPEYEGVLAHTHRSQTIALEPLEDSQIAALASELLGRHPSVMEVAGIIARRAAGNPFFAGEIVRDLAERGVLGGQRGAYVCDSELADVRVPATLQAAIAARIDRLDPLAKRTLSAAAVIGTRFSPDLLAALQIEPVLDDLLRAELIDQIVFTPRAEYAFRHPLIRTVAYESQLKSDRATVHKRLATAIEQTGSADENAALIAEHLEAGGDLREAYSWRMRAGDWSINRDIAAAHVSWERALQLADAMPDEEPDRLTMRIAPRTLICANGYRIHAPIAGARFEELQELCTTAGDKSSLAIAMAGVIADLMTRGHTHESVELSSELTALLESIGEPTLIVGLAISPMAMGLITGDMAEVLRLSQMVIDLSDSDSARANYMVGAPLAYAYASRSIARWAHGQDGWRDDSDRAVAMGRNTDLWSQSIALTGAYVMALGHNVVVADDAAVRGIEEALGAAEQSADDLALGFTLCAMGVALVGGTSTAAEAERGLKLLRQVREMAVGDRFYRSHIPLIDEWIGHGIAVLGDHERAVPVLRSANDDVFDDGQFGQCMVSTRLFVEELLVRGTEADVREAEAAIERLAAVRVLHGLAIQEITLLELRALLARAMGDEVAYRQLADRYLEMAESLGFEGHIAMAKVMT
jgi:class 3 adenylate cyclase